MALRDLLPHAWILELRSVVHVFHIHDPGDSNAILLQDEAFSVEVGATNDLAQAGARLGDWRTVYHAFWCVGLLDNAALP